MTFYEDTTKKVTDLFDKGYSYKVPLTFKVDAKDKYFFNYIHKSELNNSDKGILHDYEYKVKYEKNAKMLSFLGSNKKFEIEGEVNPQCAKCKDKNLKIKGKHTFTPKALEAEVKDAEEEKKWALFKNYDVAHEIEAKFSCCEKLGNSIKLNCSNKCFVPKVTLTSLLTYKPMLFGLNYVFDHTAQKMTSFIEGLIGIVPQDNFMAYIKASSSGLEKPEKIGLGIHGKSQFNATCETKTKDGVASETCTLPAEFGAEASVNLKKNNEFEGRIGGKLTYGSDYTLQSMFSHDFKLTSAFTFAPKKGFKLIWSDQLDTKKLFTNPKDGIDYKYGFTAEVNFDAIL